MALLKIKRSPYWYAVVRDDKSRQKWISTKTTSKSEAGAVHDELRSIYRTNRNRRYIAKILGKQENRDVILIDEVWQKYTEQKPDFPKNNYIYFQKFQRFLNKDTADISEISKKTALEFLTLFNDQSNQTYNNAKSALSAIWKALSIYDIPSNPWQEIPNRSKKSVNYRPFTKDELKRILNNCDDGWRDLCIVAFHTGLRFKDIVNLEWSSIKDNLLDVLPHKTSKGLKSVYIPIHKDVKNVLKRNQNQSRYVFPQMAERYGRRALEGEFKRILNKARVKGGKIGFPSFRTLFITRCSEAGVRYDILQGIVGHKSPAMTEHYSHDMQSGQIIANLEDIGTFCKNKNKR